MTKTASSVSRAQSRSAARLSAVQALYVLAQTDQRIDAVLRDFLEKRLGGEAIQEDPDTEAETVTPLVPPDGELFTALVRGVAGVRAQLDETIAPALSREWPMERLEMLVHTVLLCGAFELFHRPQTPPRVIISEYVDVAHAFYAGAEPRMVNAVLDRIARVVRAGEIGPDSRG